MRPAVRRLPRQAQQGMVMVMTLICLVLMLVASVALMRSSTNSLLLAGNFAFKRDLLNQGERGMAAAVALLNTGSLAAESARIADHPTLNYSASTLASNAQGIPLVLVNESTFAEAGMTDTTAISDSGASVSIRTVIERQCVAAGAYSATSCISSAEKTNAAQSGTIWIKRAKAPGRASYRISVRVTGPRNTQTFHQMVVAQ